MSMEILLIGAAASLNFGGPSMLLSVMKVLSSVLPNPRFSLMCPAKDGQREQALAERYGLNLLVAGGKTEPLILLAWGLLRRLTGLLPGGQDRRAKLLAFERAEVVVDIWGIAFADQLGSNRFGPRMVQGLHLVLGKVMGKPVVKYTADLGPFQHRWNRFFAKTYLGRFCDLVLARDRDSFEDVKKLGVRTRMRCCPDTAFLLEPAESEHSRRLARIKRDRPVVGLSVSYQGYRRAATAELYLEAMAALARHAIAKGMHVVILPNELFVTDAEKDDEDIATEINSLVADDRCEVLYTRDIPGEEIKGVVQQCDVVVAARYHTVIAALSMGIPVLAIGWHHKYVGVLSRFGLSGWVCDIRTLKADDLRDSFDKLWQQRQAISGRIQAALPAIKDEILAGANEVRALLERRSGGA